MNNKYELALIQNNLAGLNDQERLNYYNNVCTSLGLNPLTQPFSYITLNGKLTLYATRACTEQLRNLHKVSLQITNRQQVGDSYIVTAKASLPDGRFDESTGAVSIGNLKGDNLANALMKAETKAKRRVTLSICGLSFLDETELETIPPSSKSSPQVSASEVSISQKHNSTFSPKVTDAELINNEITSEQAKSIRDTIEKPINAPLISKEQQKMPESITSKIGFGQFKGMTLDEAIKTHGSDKLRDYAEYILIKADMDDKPIKGQVKEFIEAVKLKLGDINIPNSKNDSFDEYESTVVQP